MPKKKGKKKKVWKEPQYVAPFGFRADDMVITPLGVVVTVMGTRFDGPWQPDPKKAPDAEPDFSNARLIMRYPNGYEHVLAPRPLPLEPLTVFGYKRAGEALHVLRDVEGWKTERAKMEKEWERHEMTMRLRTEALNLEGTARKGKGGKSPKKLRPVTAAPAGPGQAVGGRGVTK